MISKNSQRKINKKQKRCIQVLSKDLDLTFSETPTNNIVICNAGLSNGLKQELIVEEVQKYCSIKHVIMIPGKSYCFLIFHTFEDSAVIFNEMHGKVQLGQNFGLLYMAYVEKVPHSHIESLCNVIVPPGLLIEDDFISEDEEKLILDSITWDINDDGKVLKNRQVKHFGYEFIYGGNIIDQSKPLNRGIPSAYNFLWERIKNKWPEIAWHTPDQITVNKYEPGQGIPSHVDTHSQFLDPILSLSLQGHTVMEFRNGKHHSFIQLKPRSLIVMSGESRLGWTHGIVSRMTDVVPYENSYNLQGLTVVKRSTRISLTCRKIKTDKCECNFKNLCDSFQDNLKMKNSSAIEMENENVHKVYNVIGCHFSETRHSPWPQVENFISSLPPGSTLLDIGCGNGKYLNRTDIFKIGCDRSESLLKICNEKQFNIFLSDCLTLPIKTSSVDACISIAVIHHLASTERRIKAIKEMTRVLIGGGRGLIYVWAKNQKADNNSSSYLRQNKKLNCTTSEYCYESTKSPEVNNYNYELPIHTNRTQFKHQDVLVPWKLKGQEEIENKVFLRYYHVFEENELESLCKEISTITVIKSYYDQGNWCVIFRKI